MYPICSRQIKAARASLDWSQEDLAQATGLSINTIRNLEMGYIPRGKTTKIIRLAFENAGLEFTEAEGIRRRMDDIKVIQGLNSPEIFLDDLFQTVKQKGCEIDIAVHSQKLLMSVCGLANRDNFERFERLCDVADVRCLISEVEPALFLPEVELRTASKQQIGPMPYFIYENRYTLVLPEDNDEFRFVILKSKKWIQSYRVHFLSLWENALPFIAQPSIKERRVRA